MWIEIDTRITKSSTAWEEVASLILSGRSRVSAIGLDVALNRRRIFRFFDEKLYSEHQSRDQREGRSATNHSMSTCASFIMLWVVNCDSPRSLLIGLTQSYGHCLQERSAQRPRGRIFQERAAAGNSACEAVTLMWRPVNKTYVTCGVWTQACPNYPKLYPMIMGKWKTW